MLRKGVGRRRSVRVSASRDLDHLVFGHIVCVRCSEFVFQSLSSSRLCLLRPGYTHLGVPMHTHVLGARNRHLVLSDAGEARPSRS